MVTWEQEGCVQRTAVSIMKKVLYEKVIKRFINYYLSIWSNLVQTCVLQDTWIKINQSKVHTDLTIGAATAINLFF